MDLSAASRHASRQPVIEHYIEVGFNFRMTDIQAAIGLVQLGKLDQMVARRRALAQRYQQLLSSDSGHPDHHGPGLRHHELPVILGAARRRISLSPATNCCSIWPWPVSRPGGASWPLISSPHTGIWRIEPLPVTEQLTARTLILPLFHDLTEPEQDIIVSSITAAGRNGARAYAES